MSGRNIGLIDTRPPGRIGKMVIANQRLHTDGLQLRFRSPVSRHVRRGIEITYRYPALIGFCIIGAF